jgi:hypothetical protein
MEGYYPNFLSNLGMYDRSLESMNYHDGLWEISSFVKCDRSINSNIAREGNGVCINEYWEEDETLEVPYEPCGTLIFLLPKA